MTEVHEEIAEHAGTRITQWVVIASTAAEAMAQVAAVLARQRAARDEQERAAARREIEAAAAEARLQWEPMLDPRRRQDSTLAEAGVAWASAQAWKDRNPLAQEVSDHAEERLRTLRPDAMRYYDEAREQGIDPVTAMRIAAPYFDDVIHREGQAAPDRTQLERSGVALEAGPDHSQPASPAPATDEVTEAATAATQTAKDGDVQTARGAGSAEEYETKYETGDQTGDQAGKAYLEAAASADIRSDVERGIGRRLSEHLDDPTTPDVDEHVEGLQLAVAPRGNAETASRSAEDLRQAARDSAAASKAAAAEHPTAQTLGALTYPQPLNTTSARGAAGNAAAPISPSQRVVLAQAQKAIQAKGGRTR